MSSVARNFGECDSKKNNDVLVCYAVKEEVGRHTRDQGCTVLVTGMGRRNASQSIQAELDSENYRLVLTCGFAGGLNPRLRSGTVVYCEETDANLAFELGQLGAVPGKFHCATRVAITAPEKKTLHESTGADVVEMESSVIRAICQQRQIPSATIRVISDSAQEDLPLDFNALMTSHDKIDYPKLIWKVATSPHKILALWKFQRQTLQAAAELDRVTSGLLQRI